ncbi:hypothetical protein [Bacillus phage 1]|uniref:Uncharacterized protein n=1 Tax=Bacillus phage 1 TaxID=2785079 RepID=A6XMM2_9CAUD|nr:hypothetical protein BV1_gp51 [Bacillus phage 1]ABJ09645.1 hypothetical protein [Bacillus phage 1]
MRFDRVANRIHSDAVDVFNSQFADTQLKNEAVTDRADLVVHPAITEIQFSDSKNISDFPFRYRPICYFSDAAGQLIERDVFDLHHHSLLLPIFRLGAT